ncbi:uncharacterized protein LOC110845330 isoform X2 [Folsomia candida]|uniref:uncharacterized protein LOC110845330 isoform X2 n=1 Tax=Folsomia candida TaxID=158441 RepID=UPI001604D0F9|nr:uncharacterized protein LOC110845330 isoform X2 [Folsomia candida]
MNALWRVQFRTYSDIVGISNLKMCLTRKDDDQVASLEHLPMPMTFEVEQLTMSSERLERLQDKAVRMMTYLINDEKKEVEKVREDLMIELRALVPAHPKLKEIEKYNRNGDITSLDTIFLENSSDRAQKDALEPLIGAWKTLMEFQDVIDALKKFKIYKQTS